MEQKLFTELRPLYETTKESPVVIRIGIRMRDLIDSDILRYAVDTAYRGMVFAQTQEENLLMGVASIKGLNSMFLSKESDAERKEMARGIRALSGRVLTATVSYVGKANYREAERYIRDFRLWTSTAGEGLLIEISAVNGRFALEFLQKFSSPVIVNAFLNELDENGIEYDLQDVSELKLPNIKLPWTE